jgi:haloalkane dehalogenase
MKRRLHTALVLASLGALACDDTAPDLDASDAGCVTCDTPSEDSGAPYDGCVAPFVRPFDVDARDYPFDSCAFETEVGLLHYVDEGPRDARETIVMVHGNPTWSYLYRNIARDMLEDGHRVVLMDHMGMGMSDVPPTSEFDYRPRSHSDHLDALVVALDLQNVTLVVQDWGGPIGLGMATRQNERIARILIMNTWAWSVDASAPGDYHALAGWSEQASRFPSFSPTAFCDFALTGQSELNAAEADPTRGALYERVRDAYIAPAIDPFTGDYRTVEPCAPMQIFAESIGEDDAFQAEVDARMSTLRGKPYSLLFGLSDPLFGALRCDASREPSCPGNTTCVCDDELLPARVQGGCDDPSALEFHVCEAPDGEILEPYADRFVERLGDASLVRRDVVPGADHMIQEWAPDRVVQVLRELIAHSGND